MLEILKRVQADLAELKEGQRAANMHLAAILGHMRGFHLTTSAHTEIARLEERVERIERRLDLANADDG